MGGTPPPLYTHLFAKKCLKMVFFGPKHLFFGKKSYGFGGCPPLRIFFPAKKELRIWGVPPPPFTDKIRKVVFEVFPKEIH